VSGDVRIISLESLLVRFLPQAVDEVIRRQEAHMDELARKYQRAQNFLYLGRGINYPIALEGALKLKEISYIHAEGYPAGEMKHGPIALIDENLPVVAIATGDQLAEKTKSNMQEVKARDGIVIALTDRDLAAYHGAEHKAIAAYEQGIDDVAGVPKEHDRCGSNLLAPMMLLSAGGTVMLERLVDRPSPATRAVVGLAGASIAVEMFAWSDRHHGDPLAEAFHTPGREIQRLIATKEPTPRQLEVGIAALAEILRAENGA